MLHRWKQREQKVPWERIFYQAHLTGLKFSNAPGLLSFLEASIREIRVQKSKSKWTTEGGGWWRRGERGRCTKEEDAEGGWTGQKKKCIFTWSHDRPRNLIPSDRPQRRGNEATRKNNGPVVVRVTSSSSACRGSAHALEFHRGNVERRPVSLSLLVLSSPRWKSTVKKAIDALHTWRNGHVLSSRLSRSFPPRGYSILVFPNLCISRMKGYFYRKLITQKSL